MCARLLACPLCSQPGFLSLDALRAGLISVATRPLMCPVCSEVLLGIDKLTIHLFSHTINLNNNLVESSKHINVLTTNNNPPMLHNLQDANFQDWNISKMQTSEMDKVRDSNNLLPPESPKSSQTIKNSVPSLNPELCIQNRNLSLKNIPQVTLDMDQSNENERVNTFPKLRESKRMMLETCKTSHKIVPEAIKLNCAMQCDSTENVKHVNGLQTHAHIEQKGIQTFKNWIQEQNSEQQTTCTKNITSTNINGSDRGAATIDLQNSRQCITDNTTPIIMSKESKFSNCKSFPSAMSTCNNASLEKFNNEKNIKNNSTTIDDKHQEESLKHEQIFPHLKVLKTLTTKENSERCNICGFHFPDYNILLLHKQLVHMLDEKDLNVIPENFLKNYSCHLCSKVFKMRGSLMIHMRVAHMGYNLGSSHKDGQIQLLLNDNGYNCPTCGKKFKKEQHVIQHMKTHEAKQWECDVCSKMFTTKYFLKKHKRLHSGEMPYKCNICNKTFTFQQSYHKHRLYHKDDKPHTCATCGRSFKELSTLHNHERIHTGEKPFACETCGKCFRQRVSYLVHRRIHTGVMPYKCIMCGKSFRYKVSQRTHKCPMQQTGNVEQTNNLEQSLIQLSDVQNTTNESCKARNNILEENQQMLQVINNEENKYVLIINTEGQHLLTRESDIGNKREETCKEKLEEYVGISNESKELKSIWNTDIPNAPMFRKSTENSNKANIENAKSNEEDTNDFFSMVMSPLENGLPSPTAEMEHLRVSSPIEKEVLQPYSNFKNGSNAIQTNLVNSNVEQNFNSDNNVTNTLHTINEESLKQLLYGINK